MVPVTSARSKSRVPRPPTSQHDLAYSSVLNFCPAGVSGPRSPDSRRPSSSIFWGPRSLMALDAGPAVVEAGRDRWCAADAGTRPHTLAHTDRVLTARAAGPFSRSPSSLSTILGYILAYVMRCARGCATRGSRWSRPGSREMRVCKSASVSPGKKYDVVA